MTECDEWSPEILELIRKVAGRICRRYRVDYQDALATTGYAAVLLRQSHRSESGYPFRQLLHAFLEKEAGRQHRCLTESDVDLNPAAVDKLAAPEYGATVTELEEFWATAFAGQCSLNALILESRYRRGESLARISELTGLSISSVSRRITQSLPVVRESLRHGEYVDGNSWSL